jgi:hypothetical protein
LKIHNVYGPVIEDMPALPALRQLELGGTRASTAAAAAANERYHNTFIAVHVWRAKTDEWLAAYMHHPFRDWIEDGEDFALAACQAYDRARTLIEAITSTNSDRLALAESALRGLVAELNAINEDLGEIDTNYREQAARHSTTLLAWPTSPPSRSSAGSMRVAGSDHAASTTYLSGAR